MRHDAPRKHSPRLSPCCASAAPVAGIYCSLSRDTGARNRREYRSFQSGERLACSSAATHRSAATCQRLAHSAQQATHPQYFKLYHDYVEWAANNRSFQQLAATFDIGYALTGSGEAEEIHGAVATWNLFTTVGATAELGRLFEAADVNSGPVCVISHSLWVRRFASSRDAVNRSIELNGRFYRILGVLPANFSSRAGSHIRRPGLDTDHFG